MCHLTTTVAGIDVGDDSRHTKAAGLKTIEFIQQVITLLVLERPFGE